MGGNIFHFQGQQAVGLQGSNQGTGKTAYFEVGQDGPPSLGHAVGFRCKHGQAFFNGRFRQKAGHKNHALPAHTADDDLLLV